MAVGIGHIPYVGEGVAEALFTDTRELSRLVGDIAFRAHCGRGHALEASLRDVRQIHVIEARLRSYVTDPDEYACAADRVLSVAVIRCAWDVHAIALRITGHTVLRREYTEIGCGKRHEWSLDAVKAWSTLSVGTRSDGFLLRARMVVEELESREAACEPIGVEEEGIRERATPFERLCGFVHSFFRH